LPGSSEEGSTRPTEHDGQLEILQELSDLSAKIFEDQRQEMPKALYNWRKQQDREVTDYPSFEAATEHIEGVYERHELVEWEPTSEERERSQKGYAFFKELTDPKNLETSESYQPMIDNFQARFNTKVERRTKSGLETATDIKRENSTCEIACFGDWELSLKGWQDARSTIIDQACNIGPISQVECFHVGTKSGMLAETRCRPLCASA